MAWCSATGHGARVMPEGTVHSVCHSSQLVQWRAVETDNIRECRLTTSLRRITRKEFPALSTRPGILTNLNRTQPDHRHRRLYQDQYRRG